MSATTSSTTAGTRSDGTSPKRRGAATAMRATTSRLPNDSVTGHSPRSRAPRYDRRAASAHSMTLRPPITNTGRPWMWIHPRPVTGPKVDCRGKVGVHPRVRCQPDWVDEEDGLVRDHDIDVAGEVPARPSEKFGDNPSGRDVDLRPEDVAEPFVRPEQRLDPIGGAGVDSQRFVPAAHWLPTVSGLRGFGFVTGGRDPRGDDQLVGRPSPMRVTVQRLQGGLLAALLARGYAPRAKRVFRRALGGWLSGEHSDARADMSRSGVPTRGRPMKTCSKQPFPTPKDARTAMRVIERRNRAREAWLPRGIHPCSTCRAWHITSKKQSGTAPWKRRRPAR